MKDKKNKKKSIELLSWIAKLPPSAKKYIAGKKRSRLAAVLFIIMIFVLLASTSDFFKALMIIVFLLGINLFISHITIPLARIWIGIEIILFSVVLVSIIYGAKAGMIMGLLSALVNYIGTVRFSIHCIPESLLYMMVGLTTGIFFGALGQNIVLLGAIMAILYNIALNIIVFTLLPGNYFASIIWSVTNIAFNIILFKAVGNLMLRLIG